MSEIFPEPIKICVNQRNPWLNFLRDLVTNKLSILHSKFHQNIGLNQQTHLKSTTVFVVKPPFYFVD